ncbi:phosphoribosylaminoimidazole carboxylase, catalytic subunit [Acidimicrobium ferrooxidans DSM 10331]|uniref:N5-carboxyaminoimidazole ribonucleotide mutase n=1 Tax=Acidimicrobium ferrooxidans (strain DSM 10331 / JCM 15462 / NBRC 103882 / ICP) TaxID=525909 RepID=C7M090_ACIFD|nr:phosphoribosylaminoimidazole carboxylase, catalytic subunit [Acidimicrobium ferrooxidans DSM 10331]
MTPPVAIVMGSPSDWPVLGHAATILTELEVEWDARVLSAHRTPDDMLAFARDARDLGFHVIVAGAGGAAHLPGMIAAATTLPVIGVPVRLAALEGLDSLLSIVQMPRGVPVATVGIDNATNAGLLAARILAIGEPGLADRLQAYQAANAERSRGAVLPPPSPH